MYFYEISAICGMLLLSNGRIEDNHSYGMKGFKYFVHFNN